MLKKILSQIFIIIACYPIYGEQNNKSVLEVIYEHRISLRDFYTDCNDIRSIKEKQIPCKFTHKDLFLSLVEKNFSEWKKYEREILVSFLSSCKRILIIRQNKAFIINNRIYIEILSAFLTINTPEWEHYKEEAIKNLIHNTSRDILKKFSKEIKQKLKKEKLTNNEIMLLSLLELSDEEKNKLLKENKPPDIVKARLGDEKTEDKLIKKYLIEKYYVRKVEYLEDLFYVGSEKCIKNILINFNLPVYYFQMQGKDTCYSESLRFPIIKGMRYFFPEESLLNVELYKLAKLPTYLIKDYEEKVKEYLNKFKEWAYTKYGVKPKDPDPIPYLLRGLCIDN